MICSSAFLAERGSNHISLAEKEPLRICGVETIRVMKAGIPALGRSPFEGEREIGLRHVAQNETLVHGPPSAQFRRRHVSVRHVMIDAGDKGFPGAA
jgi:hypothetical protein